MTSEFLDHDRTQIWLDQFLAEDRHQAAKLASVLQLVSADQFSEGLNGLLADRVCAGPTPIALYNETERRFWKGKPNRLFEEPRRKVLRAEGVKGPALVPRDRTVDQQVGSEGVVASVLTQFQSKRQQDAHLSPGPDTIRARKVRRFVLVSDFIGSGKRVCDFLDAAWRVRSVRSWWSRKETSGFSFEVIAFCGTQKGIAKVENHPSQPRLSVVQLCPTLDTVFRPSEAAAMVELCKRYPRKTSKLDAVGFGQIGALIGFSHSMPNNAPRLFWERTKRWEPLFPSRVTSDVDTPFRAGIGPDATEKRLEAILRKTGRKTEPISIETQVLSALSRSPKAREAVSSRLGLSLETVDGSLAELQRLGWINGNRQITERGRRVLKGIAKPASQNFLPKTNDTPYFPKALRVPRGV